ncbi:MAG: hypothetical protein K2P57_07310 [Burkholderiales bacterium]|nr:hypothetical protein [Burkholderiales bacterium]
MTVIETLTQNKKLLSPVFSDKTGKPGVFGFRGNLVLKDAAKLADEARPPEIMADQVILSTDSEKINFLGCHVDSLAHLSLIVETLRPYLDVQGKYFVFAGNIDISNRYYIELGGIGFYVLPLDEATVWNELLECLNLDRGDIKRLSSGEKIDAVADAAAKFSGKFQTITFEEGLAVMGPVRIPENRPV